MKSLTHSFEHDKENYNLHTLHGIKNFIKEAIPYNTEIEEHFGEHVVVLKVKVPWWTWRIPHFARENDFIMHRIMRYIAKYGRMGVEYRVEYK